MYECEGCEMQRVDALETIQIIQMQANTPLTEMTPSGMALMKM